jgi:hypothetical protein
VKDCENLNTRQSEHLAPTHGEEPFASFEMLKDDDRIGRFHAVETAMPQIQIRTYAL